MFHLGVNANLRPVAGVSVNVFRMSPEERNAEQAQGVMAEAGDAARDTLADHGVPRSALQDLLDQPSFTSFNADQPSDRPV